MRRKTRGAMHSKTIWFSLALVVLGVVYDNFSYIQNIIDPNYYGATYIVIGIVVAVLRLYTIKPLEEK